MVYVSFFLKIYCTECT